ncbi:MAG: hypothetical protein MUC43_13880 [Pirellula sp.]|jgi:hypothetical protein|nr:hypothetical protein [Pirellula sp.]
MNQDIPNNPYRFESGNPNAYEPTGDGKLKPFTKAVFIIHLIFGILGTIGALFGAISIVLLPKLQEMMNEAGVDEQINLNPFPGAYVLMIAMMIISGVLSIAMLWGGISGLKKKLSGLSLIKGVSAVMILYKLLELPYNIVAQYYNFQAQKENQLKQMANNPNTPDMGAFLDVILYVSIGFGVLISIGLMIFYALCYLHLNKAEVRANFR